MRPLGVVASAHVVPAGGVVFSDNFNRADGPIGSSWDGDWNIVSNSARRSSGEYVRYLTPMGSDDHWVEASLAGPVGIFNVINARGSGFVGQNAYLGFVTPGGVATIGQSLGGSYSDVATGTSGLSVSGTYTLRLEVQGSVQRLYYNNTLVATGGATTHTNGQLVGFNASDSAGVFDNFRAGPLPYTPP